MRTLLFAVFLCLPVLCQPRFEVASVKLCKPGETWPGTEAPNTGGKSSGGASIPASPGRLTLNCSSLSQLIRIAYIEFADGRKNTIENLQPNIDGGPSWLRSDRYAIAAKAEGPATQAMMLGPMLRALLEERFQLKLRRETREAPVFELTVAKDGVKMTPTPEGSCVPKDPAGGILPREGLEGKPWCSTVTYVSSRKTMSGILDGKGVTIEELAPWLYTEGRRVIVKSTVQGRFDFHLEYERGGGPPPEDPDPAHAAPPITSAVEQLGLKLTRAKGSVEFLVIDRVERPSGN